MWSLTDDPEEFASAAWDFLVSSPVEHSVLLTETAYLMAHATDGDAAQQYGWWRDEKGVSGVLVQAPRHRPLLSCLPPAAIEQLPMLLPELPPVGTDARSVAALVRAWRDAGVALQEEMRMTLYRLTATPLPVGVPGRARTATRGDRDQLLALFQAFKEAFPTDPSDLAFVIDDPLTEGGVVIWEEPSGRSAMATRTPVRAGMTRMGAVFPSGPVGEAAFAAACALARQVADHVLVLAPTQDLPAATRYRELGFRHVLDRVVLGPVSTSPGHGGAMPAATSEASSIPEPGDG